MAKKLKKKVLKKKSAAQKAKKSAAKRLVANVATGQSLSKVVPLSPALPKVVLSSKAEEKYKLPIDEIKRDLWKNVGYAVFAVVIVMVLTHTGFGLSFFERFLKF